MMLYAHAVRMSVVHTVVQRKAASHMENRLCVQKMCTCTLCVCYAATLTKIMLYAHAMRMSVLHTMVPYNVICSCYAHECGAYNGAA